MDTDALISEICRRVMEKAAALEAQGQDTADPAKPKILILTEKHGEICHETLENQILAGKYQTECALLKGEDCKAEDYEAILVYTLGDWLENVQDWGISRNRYWGTPLNIWQCECGHMHSIGSIAELKEMSDNCPDDIELHRPYIDSVTIKCPECGKEMHRVPEVIDCWFDSGAMPFAQHHYPFENKDLFEQQFPADFISEAVDQTRGWFYSLLAISTLIFNKAPYKNVIVLWHVQDENGQKKSKS